MPDSDKTPATPEAPFRDQPREMAALVIIDMINCFDFSNAGEARERAEAAAEAIMALADRAREAGCPVIYVNDNFGEWHSERSKLVERASHHEVVRRIAPREEDYFVIKPQFSGFYATNLPVLLPKLGVDRLVLTGIATEVCVLFTAADAHMRDYRLWVPRDAVVSVRPEQGEAAMAIMASAFKARTEPSGELDFARWSAGESDGD